jgi:hypothetical protein
MKQEFVPHELASELKQLGFDEPCLAYHNIDPYLKSPAFNLCKPFDHEWCLPAPLYQQAFRWFRDNHKHNGIVEGCKKYGFEWCIYPDPEHYIKPPNNFNTYEEAELACLTKLIEIVKTKTE